MVAVWVLAPRRAGPLAFGFGRPQILAVAERLREAVAAGDWIEPEWTPIPWGNNRWVRSTTMDEEWEIVRFYMDDEKEHLVRHPVPGDEGAAALFLEEWLEDARQKWLAFRAANPDAASWLPPIES